MATWSCNKNSVLFYKIDVTASVSSTNTESTISWSSKVTFGDWSLWGVRLKTYVGSTNVKSIAGYTSSSYKSCCSGSGTQVIKRTKTAQKITVKATSSSETVSGIGGVGSSNTGTASMTVTVPALASYDVTYSSNGGSGAPGAQTKWYDESLALSSTKPTRTGYIFKGWATSATGAVAYQPGASYTANKALTLYAVWELITYQINYNANGGSGAPSAQTKKWGTDINLSDTEPTRTGYNFEEWNVSKNGDEDSYLPGGLYTDNSNVTLYAIWSEKEYTVSFDANGGSNAPEPQTKMHFSDLVIPMQKPSRNKYNFIGWSKKKIDGEGTSADIDYVPGGSYKTNANVTLYALWTLAYIHPSVTVPKAQRCLKDGTLDESGTYIKVSFSWSVDTTIYSGNVANDIKIEYKATDAELWKVAYTQDPKKASGTESIVVGTGDILPEKAYEVRVIVSDDGGSRSSSMIMPQQFRTMDFGNEGNTVAFGKIASNVKGNEFGTPARFQSVHIYKDASMEDCDEIKGFVIEQGNKITEDANKNSCYWRYKKYNDGTVQLWGDMTFEKFDVSTEYGTWFKATTPRFIYPFKVTDINAYPSMGSAIQGVFTASVSAVLEDGCYVVIGSPVSYSGMAHIALYMEGLIK